MPDLTQGGNAQNNQGAGAQNNQGAGTQNQGGNAQNQGQGQAQGGTPESWDQFLEGQPENIRTLYQSHTEGLQNTVKATRQERDDLAKQLKAISEKAAKGSELEKALQDLQAKLDASNQRAQFAEEAGKPEIGCTNPKAAFALAQAEGFFGRNGAPDWNAIKAAAPELFAKKQTASGDAGNGSRTGVTTATSMDDLIRQRAGIIK